MVTDQEATDGMDVLAGAALLALVQCHGAAAPLDRTMAAAVLAESNGRRWAIGDGGRSRGPYQIHDLHGLSPDQRHDWHFSTAWMLNHEFRRAQAWVDARAPGLSAEDAATFVYMAAERPQGWGGYSNPGLWSPAAERFRAQWRTLEGVAPDWAAVEGLGSMVYVYPFVPEARYSHTHWDSNGDGRPDLAVDVFGPYLSPIRACVDGRVEVADYPAGGHTATLYGIDGHVYYHAHGVPGTGVAGAVRAGDVILRMGNSGNARSTPVHCHWAASTRAYGIDRYGQGNLVPWTLLDAWRAGRADEGDEMEQIAQLEAALAALNAKHAALVSWASSLVEDTLKPSVAQLRAARRVQGRRGWQMVDGVVAGIVQNAGLE